jgi:hypothetical protein
VTLNDTSPSPIAATAQPILNYATPDQVTPSRRTVIATRVFAVLHLLVGLGAVIFAVVILFDDYNMILVSAPMIAAGVMHSVSGILLFRPRARHWKAARLMLGLLMLPALGFVAVGVGLFVMCHEKSGWDQLAAVIGVIMALIATAPYFLNLATLAYLMRPHPRALFGVSVTDSFFGRKTFMRTMAALWVILAAVGIVAWLR